jgi:hypothetical protein
VAVLMADLVEPARIATLLKADENERAARIAERWLRPKLERVGSAPDATDVGGPSTDGTM